MLICQIYLSTFKFHNKLNSGKILTYLTFPDKILVTSYEQFFGIILWFYGKEGLHVDSMIIYIINRIRGQS